jgi:putative efflux protein, MATE family
MPLGKVVAMRYSSSIEKTEVVPTLRQIFSLAVPQMGLMLCHLGISMTDLWVAGKIDSAVVASLGIVSQVFVLLMLVTSVAGSGCLAAVSQALGANLPLRARRYAGLIVTLAFCAGAVVGLLGYCSLPLILSLLRVPAQLLQPAQTFISIYCLNLPFFYALILINSVFRAYKLVRLPFYTFFLVFCVNLAGSVGFGLGYWGLPNCGYAGIAWATFASTLVGLACNLVAVKRHGIIRRDSFAPWRWNMRAIPYLLRVGIPSALGQLVEHGGRMVMLGVVTALPDSVNILAGMTLGMRIHSVLMFPLGAVGLTMGIFSGHMLGAGNTGGLLRFGKKVSVVTAALFALPAIALYYFREPAAALMASEPEAIRHAAYYLSFACLGVPALACGVTLNGLFAGAGATPLSLLAGCFSMWAVQVPLGWHLAHSLAWGEQGVFLGILCAEFTFAGCTMALFASRKWLAFGLRKHIRNG